uniref:Uncharacterized protein n=1 Tax=Paulinella longichromatophora TaxID=1708747 RepID=A0A2H4ZNJ7_9EUKA|nr:hypothetical protein PLO_107 [Paulinella longichromatophora]
MAHEQNHPFYYKDRVRVNELINCAIPVAGDLVDLARLFIRYQGFPGAYDLQDDLRKILKIWNYSQEELNNLTRKLWESGDALETKVEDAVGSAFDTSDSEDSL